MNRIYNTDCVKGMKGLPDGCIDCCVTAPPRGIKDMVSRRDYNIPAVEVWKEVWRLLKPGAHMLVACGTLTQHRMAVNVEDAGFDIREVITRHYALIFSQALKTATELWTLARKPLEEKTIAENVMKFGTGALNIDACRIETDELITNHSRKLESVRSTSRFGKKKQATHQTEGQQFGRFPANLILDEFSAEELDRQSGVSVSTGGSGEKSPGGFGKKGKYGAYALNVKNKSAGGLGDFGGASRFFYVTKADPVERGRGNSDDTVKPMTLMGYLIKLICPIEPGRIVLEPFAGSATTCIAARKLGVDFMAFESNADSVGIAERRLREELGLFYDG